MEDEDDSYGFGSYSELFDGGSAASSRVAPALDVAAMRRFWMPERLLRQLQQRQDGETGFGVKEFQHVGARFDGHAVDGGLGRVSLVHPRDVSGGGVLWLQAAKSDSNAQQKRKRQLGADARSSAALFVPLGDITGVSSTSIQNTVQGVELTLVDGHRLHLAFLPGPFFNVNNRDEFLAIVNQRLEGQRGAGVAHSGESKVTNAESTRLVTPRKGRKASREVAPKREATTVDADAAATARNQSPRVETSKVAVDRDAMRALVRKYSTLNEFSDEAIRLARQVHEATGYYLGPLAKKFPRFSVDATHRKKAVQQLSKFLAKMNDEWSRADAHRELHTNTRSFRNQDEVFQYTDAATGEDVSPRSYESRYAQYARLEDKDPVIRCFSSREATSDGVDSTDSYKAELSALLGVDVASSCVIDEEFFKDDPTVGDSQQASEADSRPEATAARQVLWQRWESAFSDYIKQRDAITGAVTVNTAVSTGARDGATAHSTLRVNSSGVAARKRPQDRRRSIVPPSEVAPLDELATTQPSPTGSGQHDYEPSPSHGKRRRRSSSSSPELPAVGHTTARRKSRRQSITGAVDTSLLAADESQDDITLARSAARSKRGTPPPSRAQSNENDREDESKESEEELCQLCFSESADVEMDPCSHRVCGTCWYRLTPGGGGSSDIQREHMCPWDRELVSRR